VQISCHTYIEKKRKGAALETTAGATAQSTRDQTLAKSVKKISEHGNQACTLTLGDLSLLPFPSGPGALSASTMQ
jgi:hypothetical protein